MLLGSNIINALAIDKNNNLWIGTSAGLNKWDNNRKPKSYYIYDKSLADTTTLWGSAVQDIFIDTNNTIWVATGGGFNKHLPKTNNFKRFPYPDKRRFYSLESFIQREKNILYGAGSNFIYKLNTTTNKLTRFETNLQDMGVMPSIVQTKDNTIWIATRNLGVAYFNPSKSKFQLYQHQENNKNSLPYRNVWSAIKTKDGIVWAGTDEGLTRISKENRVQPFF